MAHTLHDVSLGSSVIKQILALTHNVNATIERAKGSGEVDANAQFQGETIHSTTVTSTDLETILALASGAFITTGLCLDGSTTTVPFRKRVPCSTFATGNSHSALTSSHVFALPMSIDAQGNRAAEFQFDLKYLSSNGLASPVTVTSGNALAAAVFNKEYVFRKAVLNGSEVPEITGAKISFGIQLIEQKGIAGGVFPTAVFISDREPTIDLTTEDVDSVLALANTVAIGGSGLQLYLARRKPGSTLYGDAEQISTVDQHIKIATTTGLGLAQSINGQAENNSSGVIRLWPASANLATTPVLLATNNVAIP